MSDRYATKQLIKKECNDSLELGILLCDLRYDIETRRSELKVMEERYATERAKLNPVVLDIIEQEFTMKALKGTK